MRRIEAGLVAALADLARGLVLGGVVEGLDDPITDEVAEVGRAIGGTGPPAFISKPIRTPERWIVAALVSAGRSPGAVTNAHLPRRS